MIWFRCSRSRSSSSSASPNALPVAVFRIEFACRFRRSSMSNSSSVNATVQSLLLQIVVTAFCRSKFPAPSITYLRDVVHRQYLP